MWPSEVNSKREWVEKHFDLQNIKEQLLAFGKFRFRSVFMIGSERVRARMLGYCLPQSCNSVLKRPKVFTMYSQLVLPRVFLEDMVLLVFKARSFGVVLCLCSNIRCFRS